MGDFDFNGILRSLLISTIYHMVMADNERIKWLELELTLLNDNLGVDSSIKLARKILMYNLMEPTILNYAL